MRREKSSGLGQLGVTLLMWILLAISVFYISSDRIVINTPYYLNDLWFTTSSMWRAHLGDVPHLDFQTALGQGYFWPYLVSNGIFGPGVQSILFANVVIGFSGALLCALILRRDIAPWVVIVTALFVFSTSLSPRWMDGRELFLFSHLAAYNRWGWGLLAIIAVYSFARRNSKDDDPAAAIICGAICAYLAFLKITFGAAAVGFLGLAWISGNRSFFELMTAAVTFLLFVAGVAAVFGNVTAYLEDLWRTGQLSAQADPFGERYEKRWMIVRTAKIYGVVIVALVLASVLSRLKLKSSVVGLVKVTISTTWRPLLYSATLLAASLVLAVQNHPKQEAPFFFIPLVVAASWLTLRNLPWAIRSASDAMRFGANGLIAVTILVAAILTPLRDLTEIIAHRLKAADTSNYRPIPELESTPMAGLRLPVDALERAETLSTATEAELGEAACCNHSFIWRLSLAMRGLEDAEIPQDAVVLALTTFDPYPALRQAPAQHNGVLWYDLGRTFSEAAPTAPERFLENVDAILVPAPTGIWYDSDEALWRMYGAYIEENFSLASQSKQWRVFSR